MSDTVLIVGASRGIGLGLAREYKARGWQVIATVRGDAPPELADARVERLELTDVAQGAALAAALAGEALRHVILNAGVMSDKPFPAGAEDGEIARMFGTNAVAPVRLARQLLPLVADGGAIGFMSSRVGSVGDNDGGGMELYRASKAALNSLVRSFSVTEVRRRPLAVLSLHPGWVRTDMGGAGAQVSVDESARGLADVMAAEAGKPGHRFVDYRGQVIPW